MRGNYTPSVYGGTLSAMEKGTAAAGTTTRAGAEGENRPQGPGAASEGAASSLEGRGGEGEVGDGGHVALAEVGPYACIGLFIFDLRA